MQEQQRTQTREATACLMTINHGVGVMDIGAAQPNAFFQKLKRKMSKRNDYDS
jgi:hypothetical protein